jgi:hypothetical protein
MLAYLLPTSLKLHRITKLFCTTNYSIMRTKFLIFGAIGLLLGCDSSKETTYEPIKNTETARYEKITSEFNAQFLNSFNYAKTIKPLTVTKLSQEVGSGKLEREKILVSTSEYLIENYYKNFKAAEAKSFYQRPSASEDIKNARTTEDAAISAINGATIFNDEQKELMGALVSGMSDLADISGANGVIAAFNEKVATSGTLSEEEKVQLLAFSSLSSSFATFMNNGGAAAVYSSMAAELGVPDTDSNNARVSAGCTVNWRSVWAGAVIGFGIGAVSGGKVGLAGGTVVLPGVGSATGAVGGAVLGGASGFVGGTVTGVAAELLTSCFRNIESTDATCKRYFDRFVNGEIDALQIPESCIGDIKINITLP